MYILRGLTLATLGLAFSCTLFVSNNNEQQPQVIGEGEGEGEGEVTNPFDGNLGYPIHRNAGIAPELPACDPLGPTLTEDQLRVMFADDVHPKMISGLEDGGCIACHDVNSGRALTITGDADESYSRLLSASMLMNGPGTMLERIENQTMPPGGPFWSSVEVGTLSAFICEVEKQQSTVGVPPDELFPAALEQPYMGEASTEYDNTFLTYDQLKGRVQTTFGDDWVRDGVDLFNDNISLFGGVNFDTAYTPARGATPEFLIAVSTMAEDVCTNAAENGSGPFTNIDINAPIRGNGVENTVVVAPPQMQSITYDGAPRDTPFSVSPNSINVFSRGGARSTFTATGDGEYRIVVRAQGQEAGPELPRMTVRAGGNTTPFNAPAGLNDYTVTYSLNAGEQNIDVLFENDFYDPNAGEDRNLVVASVSIEGPLGAAQDGDSESLTKDRLALLFERILLREPARGGEGDEVNELYDMLIALDNFGGGRAQTYSGVCEALIQHPDFLFTRPPSVDFTDDARVRGRGLVIKSALDIMNRVPTSAELEAFENGDLSREQLVDQWLESDDFRNAYYHKMRILLEADGSEDGNEPARLMTYVFSEDRPIKDTLVADYTVDANFNQIERPAEHGATGVLTMKGYLNGKPGLPHYNYPARVLQGFMGEVFVVPDEVFEERATSTAASTVAPTSLCFSCHKLLTPLAHQRLKWDDEGNYRETDETGNVIDDSDRDLVAGYPYAGDGLESFSTVAYRKEGFVRRMANLQFETIFLRPMRHEEDERLIYRQLWNVIDNGEGTSREVLKDILFHQNYIDATGTNPVGEQ